MSPALLLQEARNERLLTTLNIDQALDARDAIAKALYSALFSWLVRRINQIICNTKPSSTNISILDIFGFESFKVLSLVCELMFDGSYNLRVF